MTASVKIQGVTLDYHIYNIRARSLKNAVFNMAVGGKFFKGESDVVVLRALENISFSLGEGDRLGLYGHNGSGKSSLLRVVAGIYPPTRGVRSVQGNLSSMIDMGFGTDPEATGMDNLRQFALSRGIHPKLVAERLPEIVEFSELGAFINLPIRTYSAGMQARLMFSVATAFNVEILVLDEWLGAGDADFQEKAQNRMAGMVDSAKIVVFASHNIKQLKRVCNQIMHLEAGKVVYYGPSETWNG
jgi:lipopolysaccharide transport system ATP-binding protein